MLEFDYSRPKLLVSRCLEFAACRYDGQIIKNSLIANLRENAEFVTVCPEADIGMGIPRPTIRIERFDDDLKLYQPKTGNDFFDKMKTYASEVSSKILEIDGVIFKAKSPSCGIKGIPVYKSGNKTQEKRSGVFAGQIIDQHPNLYIEDEGRLNNFVIRENFLTKLYSISHFNSIRHTNKMKDLVQFHSDYKYLMMSYNQSKMRELGRITANHVKRPIEDVYTDYHMKLIELFSKNRNKRNTINTLHHMFGYFSKVLSKSEKSHFLKLVESYRKGEIPLFLCNQLLISWIYRTEQSYLKNQRFFAPFPSVLMDGAQPE